MGRGPVDGAETGGGDEQQTPDTKHRQQPSGPVRGLCCALNAKCVEQISPNRLFGEV